VRQRDLAAGEGRLDRGLEVRGRIDLGELRALEPIDVTKRPPPMLRKW
jgi:hypothetical protein